MVYILLTAMHEHQLPGTILQKKRKKGKREKYIVIWGTRLSILVLLLNLISSKL